MHKSFGSLDLCKFLEDHSFAPRKKKATSHLVYIPPYSFKVSPKALRPFVTVVLGRKSYDPVTANCIRRNLLKLGFTEDEINDGLG